MSIQGFTNACTNPNTKFFNYTSPSNPKFDEDCRVNLRVCAKTKDFEVKLTSPKPNTGTYGQFSSPVKPIGPSTSSSSSKQRKEEEDEERQNYHLNMGYAIRSLREEFPELFDRELAFDIYREEYSSRICGLRSRECGSQWRMSLPFAGLSMASHESHGKPRFVLMASQSTSLTRMGKYTSIKLISLPSTPPQSSICSQLRS